MLGNISSGVRGRTAARASARRTRRGKRTSGVGGDGGGPAAGGVLTGVRGSLSSQASYPSRTRMAAKKSMVSMVGEWEEDVEKDVEVTKMQPAAEMK